METVSPALEFVALVIDFFGVTLLVLGFTRGAVGWVRTEVGREPWEQRIADVRRLRCVVGVHILYAMELMIVSDVIKTLIDRFQLQAEMIQIVVGGPRTVGTSFLETEVFHSLAELALVVLIRTVIDYFLGREIEGLRASPLPS